MKPISRNLLLLAMAGALASCATAGENQPKQFTTEIHEAVRVGDLAKVKRLLDAKPELVNECDGWAQTPLHTAAIHSRETVANLLLRYHPDINDKDLLN